MPKDGYVCARTFVSGMARSLMPRQHRAAFTGGERSVVKVEFDSRRAFGLLKVLFCVTPSIGLERVLAEPDSRGTLAWPASEASKLTIGANPGGLALPPGERCPRSAPGLVPPFPSLPRVNALAPD